jgi:hypothetical protein
MSIWTLWPESKQTGKFAALDCFGLILVTLFRFEGNLTENTVA